GTLDFSYSGLKSQALLEIERLERTLGPLDLGGLDGWDGPAAGEGEGPGAAPPQVLGLLAAFRAAAVGQLLSRLDRLAEGGAFAANGSGASVLAVSGGAAANRLLRRLLPEWAARHGVDLRLVPLVY